MPFSVLSCVVVLFLLSLVQPTAAVKFKLVADRYPKAKCIWNTAHENALIIVTANVGPGQ